MQAQRKGAAVSRGLAGGDGLAPCFFQLGVSVGVAWFLAKGCCPRAPRGPYFGPHSVHPGTPRTLTKQARMSAEMSM